MPDAADGISGGRDEIIEKGISAGLFSKDEIARCIGPGYLHLVHEELRPICLLGFGMSPRAVPGERKLRKRLE